MATKIDTLEGVGPALAEKFAGAGVKNVEDLLRAAHFPQHVDVDRALAARADERNDVAHPLLH